MSKTAEITALLEEATKECGAAKHIADRLSTYTTAKAKAQRALTALEKLPPDQKKPFEKVMVEAKTKIGQAIAKAEKEKKPADAIPLLTDAEKKLNSVKTQGEMQAALHESVPNVAYIKQLMNEAGGTDALDALVKGMGDNTNRNVLEAALEARFNISFSQKLTREGAGGKLDLNNPAKGASDLTAPDKSVKRIYELLQKVPESHVADNTKLTSRAIERSQEDVGSAAYWRYDKNNTGEGKKLSITLNCGRAGATGSKNQKAELCHSWFFPDGVDENCKPNAKTMDAKTDIRYFDWATLHEVGHAVDDKMGVMKSSHGKDRAFGGWEVYESDVSKTAEAIQKKFGYDLNYIKQKLSRVPVPTVPAHNDATKQAAVDKFCANVLSYGVWWNGALSKQVEIDGRVYQHMGDENKPPRLVSYLAEARKRGIHGYQFRAPAEWFAELYAAYYLEVLKPEHPSVAAIKKAFPEALADRPKA